MTLGPFSGEAFDVRLYAGALTDGEVELVGGWCGDAGELKMYETLETPFLRGGCEPDVDPVPSDDGVQTYGTGAFGTLWVAPHEYDTQWWGPNAEEGYSMKPVGANADYNWVEADYTKGVYYDVTEDMLDLDQFFQELKLTQYTWERNYFELDLLPINLAPWYWYADAGKVPGFSERVWNNPCRYIHQHNNGWTSRRSPSKTPSTRSDEAASTRRPAFPYPPIPGTKTLLLSTFLMPCPSASRRSCFEPPDAPAAEEHYDRNRLKQI